MKTNKYITENGTVFSSKQILEICERIEANEDWQRIINDDIWQEVGCDENNAWEVYNYCESLVQDQYEREQAALDPDIGGLIRSLAINS